MKILHKNNEHISIQLIDKVIDTIRLKEVHSIISNLFTNISNEYDPTLDELAEKYYGI